MPTININSQNDIALLYRGNENETIKKLQTIESNATSLQQVEIM